MLRNCTKQVRGMPLFTSWFWKSQNELERANTVSKSTSTLTEYIVKDSTAPQIKPVHRIGNTLRLVSSEFINIGLRI